jgi:hypothetical protein
MVDAISAYPVTDAAVVPARSHVISGTREVRPAHGPRTGTGEKRSAVLRAPAAAGDRVQAGGVWPGRI